MYIGEQIRQNFQGFYYVLLQQLKKSLTQSAPADDQTGKTVDDLQLPLIECLKKQMITIQENFFGQQRQDLLRGVYLSAALGDELHLNHPWFGQIFWKSKMLEHQLFQTQNAGEQIPTDLDDIMRKPQGYPFELVEIYFLLLALGFKGRLLATQIGQYQKRLLGILFPTAPFLFDHRQTELIPGHETSVDVSKACVKFLDTRRWFIVFTGFMAVFTTVTTYFWYAYHQDIKVVVQQLDRKTLRLT